MKTVKQSIYKGVVYLVILVISGCYWPGNRPASQDQNLLQTVSALNTIVVAKSESTQAPSPAVQPSAAQPPTKQGAATATPQQVVPSPTATLEFTATPIPHSLRPAQPDWVVRWFLDSDSSRTAGEKRAPGGDYFQKNIFDRPFTANDMNYRPDLDINKAEISSDSSFIYVSIYLNGVNSGGGGLPGMYGVELDTDFDGRGNYLIWASNPSGADWKMENVSAYKDSGKKVGGASPMQADSPSGYIGYDQTIFGLTNLSDPDAAWARVSPKGASIVEVAFKPSLVGGSNQFLWNVWADDGVKDPQKFDYNDHFSLSEAGSPYQDGNYPLKALAQVDNTCREVSNYTPVANIPGLCALPPTVTPTPTTKPSVPSLKRLLFLTSPFMTGADVKTLQNRLLDLGYNLGTADGIFGPKTNTAVRAFQSSHGLAVDGKVGPLTWAALFK